MNKLIYIASPYTLGDSVRNVRESIFVAEKLIAKGYTPIVPLLSHFWHFLSPHDYEWWMDYDLAMIEHCDILIRLDGESKGADREVEHAKSLGIPCWSIRIDDNGFIHADKRIDGKE